MLRSNTQKSMAIPTESALRHKVRNLRAKVRLLLPSSTCCKYEKRAKLIQKIQYNLMLQQQSQQKSHRWTHDQQKPQKLYIKSAEGKSQPVAHFFHKLDQHQIEQIKEDKLYYLGESHVKEFDEWLLGNDKHKKQKQNESKEDKEISNRKMSVVCFKEDFMEDNKSNRYYSKIHSTDILRVSNQHLCSSKPISSMIDHRDSIMENRRNLESLQKTKNAVIKLKRAQKLKNHQLKLHMLFQQSERRRTAQREMTKQRTSRARQIKQRNQEIGQITKLNELLREICIRNSKSAQ